MIGNAPRIARKPVALTVAIFLAGCSRAPSFDVFGSFFPAWMLCLAAGLVLTAASHWLLMRVHVTLAIPTLTYPSLTALFTLALWMTFFQ